MGGVTASSIARPGLNVFGSDGVGSTGAESPQQRGPGDVSLLSVARSPR